MGDQMIRGWGEDRGGATLRSSFIEMEEASWSLQIIHVDQKYHLCRSKTLQNLFVFEMQMGDQMIKGWGRPRRSNSQK